MKDILRENALMKLSSSELRPRTAFASRQLAGTVNLFIGHLTYDHLLLKLEIDSGMVLLIHYFENSFSSHLRIT